VGVSFSSPSKQAFKKRIKDNAGLEARLWQKLGQFTIHPFDPGFKMHKLSGKLKEFWSFSIDYD
jgi:mRNA-degrading endonuclease YafQ of YafQ-DinJ toxin-antitoxin module